MLSPLRYPGGKAKLYPFFVELIRKNQFFEYSYCEPYAGGAGLALKLLAHGFVSSIEINDVDPSIAAFWRSVLYEPHRFCEKILNVNLSVAEWQNQREIYAKLGQGDDFALGFATYFLNRTSRSGIIEGSGPIGGYAQKSEWTIDARFNRTAQINQVMEIARFSNLIKVTQLDALDFFSKRVSRTKTLTYLDPPYYVKGRKLYKNFYEHKDHECIAKLLRDHSHANWVLSYDYVQQIADLYRDFEPLIYDLQYSAGRAGLGREVIYAGHGVVLPDRAWFRKVA